MGTPSRLHARTSYVDGPFLDARPLACIVIFILYRQLWGGSIFNNPFTTDRGKLWDSSGTDNSEKSGKTTDRTISEIMVFYPNILCEIKWTMILVARAIILLILYPLDLYCKSSETIPCAGPTRVVTPMSLTLTHVSMLGQMTSPSGQHFFTNPLPSPLSPSATHICTNGPSTSMTPPLTLDDAIWEIRQKHHVTMFPWALS